MLTSTVRELSEAEAEDFKKLLKDDFKLPSIALGERAINGSSFQPFSLKTEETKYVVGVVPSEMTHEVDMENPKKVDTDFVVLNRDEENAWYIPQEVTKEHPYLPDVRQAFHEGESNNEREANYKYHFDNESAIAVSSPNPVKRLENEVTFTAVEYLGGDFPQNWILEDGDGNCYYLRERSGSIRLYDALTFEDREEIFNAYVGREHPGTWLDEKEVLDIVTSMEYFTIADDADGTVSEECKEEYWADFGEEYDELEFEEEIGE